MAVRLLAAAGRPRRLYAAVVRKADQRKLRARRQRRAGCCVRSRPGKRGDSRVARDLTAMARPITGSSCPIPRHRRQVAGAELDRAARTRFTSGFPPLPRARRFVDPPHRAAQTVGSAARATAAVLPHAQQLATGNSCRCADSRNASPRRYHLHHARARISACEDRLPDDRDLTPAARCRLLSIRVKPPPGRTATAVGGRICRGRRNWQLNAGSLTGRSACAG